MAKPKPPAPPPAELLDELQARIPAFRALGVTEIEVGGVRVTIGPAATAPSGDPDDEENVPIVPEPRNALEDPLTFGMRPGARPPGFKRREPDDDRGDPRP